MNIVGGVYYEKCMKPYVNDMYGSGGRAAIALSRLLDNVKLYSYFDENAENEFSAIASSFNVKIQGCRQNRQICFSYVHPLAVPIISPSPLVIKNAPIKVDGNIVLQFGMVEGDSIVSADIAIYDPQDAYNPKLFRSNGSTANKLSIVVNKHEGFLLTGLRDAKEIAEKLYCGESATAVVVKMGAQGALVYEAGHCDIIPCFKTNNVHPIGSGDIFSAVFAYEWGELGKSAREAALSASIAVSNFCDNHIFPVNKILDIAECGLTPVSVSQVELGSKVYLAGPFFSLSQLWLIQETKKALESFGLRVFSPYHHIGEGPGVDVAPKDIAAIKECDVVFAIFSGQDAGTIFEIGFARALGKPVIVFVENEKTEDLKMIEGSGCIICNDFSSAIYRTSWIIE